MSKKESKIAYATRVGNTSTQLLADLIWHVRAETPANRMTPELYKALVSGITFLNAESSYFNDMERLEVLRNVPVKEVPACVCNP